MNEFVAKLSSYNLLNYLLVGVVFATLAERLVGLKVSSENVVVAVFVYYFIGLVVSRFGSVLLEPILKTTHVVEFADYPDFVRASREDEKLEVLSEQNNVYRTLAAAILLLLLLLGWVALTRLWPVLVSWQSLLAMIALLLLFLFSYRKQCGYIVKRVRTVLASLDTPTPTAESADPEGRS